MLDTTLPAVHADNANNPSSTPSPHSSPLSSPPTSPPLRMPSLDPLEDPLGLLCDGSLSNIESFKDA